MEEKIHIKNISKIISKQKDNDEETLIYKEFIYNEESSSIPIKYTYSIITKYLNECEFEDIKKIKSKIRMRNIAYLGKILKNKYFKVKQRESINIVNEKKIITIFYFV